MCFFLNKKVHLLVSELYIYQNAWRNNKKKNDLKSLFRKGNKSLEPNFTGGKNLTTQQLFKKSINTTNCI